MLPEAASEIPRERRVDKNSCVAVLGEGHSFGELGKFMCSWHTVPEPSLSCDSALQLREEEQRQQMCRLTCAEAIGALRKCLFKALGVFVIIQKHHQRMRNA